MPQYVASTRPQALAEHGSFEPAAANDFMQKPVAERARELTQGRGELQHNLAERMALGDIVKAHEAVQSGRLPGNLVLRFPSQ